jgi:hypothetical protein
VAAYATQRRRSRAGRPCRWRVQRRRHGAEPADVDAFLARCRRGRRGDPGARLRPGALDANAKAALLDLAAYGALARALRALGDRSPEVLQILVEADAVWASAMGDTNDRRVDRDGTFPVIAALLAGAAAAARSSSAGSSGSDETDYGRPAAGAAPIQRALGHEPRPGVLKGPEAVTPRRRVAPTFAVSDETRPALVLEEGAVSHGEPVHFANFPGLWIEGQPVAVSELGFDDDDAAFARAEELGLPLDETTVAAGEGAMPDMGGRAPSPTRCAAPTGSRRRASRAPSSSRARCSRRRPVSAGRGGGAADGVAARPERADACRRGRRASTTSPSSRRARSRREGRRDRKTVNEAIKAHGRSSPGHRTALTAEGGSLGGNA